MSLQSLIHETYQRTLNVNSSESVDYPNTLLSILKEKHYYPAIKIKKFKSNPYLCLLHNSYKRDDVNDFKELYDECRSVILDFSRSIGNNVVISYANSIPIRLSISNYLNSHYDASDICYTAMDGTLITAYYHDNSWHFGSSCCPDINGSKFSHPTKSHGYMFDEVLYEIYKNNVKVDDPNISTVLRDLFTANLSKLYSYEFVLIHHENKHIVDYTSTLGENYKYLFHINTKNRISLVEEDIRSKPLEYLGIKYPHYFANLDEAIQYASTTDNSLIIKKLNKRIYKISNDKVLHLEEVHSNNYNVWYNFVYVYMLQKPGYSIDNYIQEFYPDLINIQAANIIISQVFLIMTDIIYNLYIATTNYYPKYKRFKTNLDLDRTFAPVVRFHLAQLRHQQTTLYTKAIITKKEVFDYLCHSNNIKNIKKLIYHFALTPKYDVPLEQLEVFKQLLTFLSS
jgi:hypothetical protein